MATAWYLVPYEHTHDLGQHVRVLGRMLALSAEIEAAGGYWAESEIWGDRAIVKVRAPQALLGRLGRELLDHGWTEHEWAEPGYLAGGYGQGTEAGSQMYRERLWSSPHCVERLSEQQTLFLVDSLHGGQAIEIDHGLMKR